MTAQGAADKQGGSAPFSPSGTKIKCCGMSREEDIAAVNDAKPDMCGFVIDFPKSHRSVTPERARELAALLDRGIAAVGVFVDEPVAQVAELVADNTLDAVQLHGHEDVRYLRELRTALSGITGRSGQAAVVIQAFRVRAPADIAAANASTADLVLLDNGQGTGEAFDWSLLQGAERDFLLAGGLSPGNLPQAIRQVRPWGVDLSSGLETDGVKDPDKIEQAVSLVRSL